VATKFGGDGVLFWSKHSGGRKRRLCLERETCSDNCDAAPNCYTRKTASKTAATPQLAN